VVETKKRRPHAPMDGVLLRALRAERKEHPDRKYVIHYRGGAIGLIRKSFLDAAKKAKLKNVSPHTLKHTCITWHLQNGFDGMGGVGPYRDQRGHHSPCLRAPRAGSSARGD
jgi:integrase